MTLKKFLVSLSILIVAFLGSSQSVQDNTQKDGEVVNVTLYRGQAQVTRARVLAKGSR